MNYDARIDAADSGIRVESALNGDPAETRSNRRRMILIVVGIALALVAIWFAMKGGKEDDFAARPASQLPTVTVVTPGRTTVAGTITAPGTLAARRELPVGSAGEGGQVVQVLVDAGQWVRKGQALAVVDRSVQSEQAASQQAQIQVAQADARLAQANLDRALKLVGRGFISRADVDRLTATRDAANARVRVAQSQLGELSARIRRLNIVAPEAGLVLSRSVEPGQIVGAGGTVLFRIAQGGEMEMLAKVSETDLAQLNTGVSAEITPVGSARAFPGQVWQISPTIDPQTRQGTARIALSYAAELRPGGFASAVIKSGTVVAPVLPESAIQTDDKGSFVLIVGAGNKVERRAVKSGLVTAAGITIAEGLTGSERVVLRAGGFLSPGDAIRPQPLRAGA